MSNGNANGNGNTKRWQAMDSKLLDPSAGQYRQPPSFPGHGGLPFRGTPPDLKNSDPEHLQPRQGARVHVEVLDMWNDDHVKRLEDVFQMVANGYAIISKEREVEVPEHNSIRVFLRWAEMFVFDPRKGNVTNG